MRQEGEYEMCYTEINMNEDAEKNLKGIEKDEKQC